jgi:hypothetical protein
MKRLIFLISLVLAFMWGCEQVKDWHDATDTVAPGPLTNVSAINISGGAKIIYTLPADKDLLGAKAVFTLNDGVEREILSSSYTDTLLLEGFADTNEHTVLVYAVDKSYNVSTPVQVTIKPDSAQINLSRASIEYVATFGGVYLFWSDEQEKDIAVSLYIADESGDYEFYDTAFSNEKEGQAPFRGLENVERKFRVEMRDQWGNYAENFDFTTTPLVREEVFGRVGDKVWWNLVGWDGCSQLGPVGTDTTYKWRGDAGPGTSCTRGFHLVYNDYLFGDGDTYWQWGPTPADYFAGVLPEPFPNSPLPFYITIDMGRKAAYSDMRFWMRNRSSLGSYFSARAWTVFNVWGTNELKSVDQIGDKAANLRYWTDWNEIGGTDEWKNDWVKIGHCELVLPSGITKSSQTSLTAEDNQFVRDGFPFDMDPRVGAQAFRYIRFEVIDTNGSAPGMDICEIRFWGMIMP